MNQILVVGMDISDLGDLGINLDELKLINLNVTNQQGAPINPSPVRASLPGTTATGGGGGQQGSTGTADDTSGAGNRWRYVGIRPPAGQHPRHWEEAHAYHKGEAVSDSSGLHYYVANAGFNSGTRPTDPFPPQPRVERVLDGTVVWQEMNAPTSGTSATYWRPDTAYRKGAIVCVGRGPKTESTPTIGELMQELSAELRLPNSDHQIPSLLRMPARFSTVSLAKNPPQEFTVSMNKPCESASHLLAPVGKGHLHYFFAVMAGTSGQPPPDPISLNLISRAIYLAWPYQLPGVLDRALSETRSETRAVHQEWQVGFSQVIRAGLAGDQYGAAEAHGSSRSWR